MPEELITRHAYELSEPPCAPGSGRYGLRVTVFEDISAAFPYLNAVLEDTRYDHENKILIGREGRRQYAMRANEILVAGIDEASQAQEAVRGAIDLVNRVWRERGAIKPRFAERKQPTVIDIYQRLPRTNCRQCGYVTCLAFASDVRAGKCRVEQCPPLTAEGQEAVRKLWAEG